MLRFRTILTTIALTAGMLAAEEAPLPPAVAKELDGHAARMAKIDQEAEKSRTDERARMYKVLDDSMKNETKKGNLETAVRIRQLRDNLQPKQTVSSNDLLGDEAAQPARTPPQPGQPLAMTAPQLKQAQEAILGSWSIGVEGATQVWTVKPAGVFTRKHANGRESNGTWRVAEGRITFIYESGRELPMARVDAKQLVVLREGNEMVLVREAAH